MTKGKVTPQANFYSQQELFLNRGSWLDFEFDPKDILNVRIDRRRKLPCTTLLMALLDDSSESYLKQCNEKNEEPDRTQLVGMGREEILNFFYDTQIYEYKSNKWTTKFSAENYKGQRLIFDIVDASNDSIIANSGDKVTPRKIKALIEGV